MFLRRNGSRGGRRAAVGQDGLACGQGAARSPRTALPALGGSCLALALGYALGAVVQRARVGGAAHAGALPPPRRAMHDAAVRRVCHAIVSEFAQPLSGVLAYSELLLQHPLSADDAQRYELRGLREGALRLERLLLSLREAVRAGTPLEDGDGLADRVEHAIGQARSHAPTRIA